MYFLFSVIIFILCFTSYVLFYSRNVNWPLDPVFLSALMLGLDTEHSQARVWRPRHVFLKKDKKYKHLEPKIYSLLFIVCLTYFDILTASVSAS